jgi:hypothetical protein
MHSREHFLEGYRVIAVNFITHMNNVNWNFNELFNTAYNQSQNMNKIKDEIKSITFLQDDLLAMGKCENNKIEIWNISNQSRILSSKGLRRCIIDVYVTSTKQE